MRPLSVKTRLTLWHLVLLSLVLAIICTTVYVVMSRSLVGNVDASLRQRVAQVTPYIDVTNTSMKLTLPKTEEQPPIPVALLSIKGQPIGVGSHVPASLRRHLTLPQEFRFTTFDVNNFRLGAKLITNNNRRIGYVLTWESLGPLHSTMRSLLSLLLIVGPLILLVAGVGGNMLARHALAPVAEITKAASTISTHNLSERVPVPDTRDEISQLASTFNAMIGRLDSAVARERRFTADASHELRSPLAVLLAEVSLAQERELTAAEYQRVLAVVHEQTLEMQALTESLLVLARADSAGSGHDNFSLDSAIGQAVAQARRPTGLELEHVEVAIPPGTNIQGDRTLVSRAIANVVENAYKVIPPGGRIRISAKSKANLVTVTIDDEGPGIPTSMRKKVFEPFFQIDAARTPDGSHGLGLGITQAIVRVHGGDVRITESPSGGARIELTFSRTRESESTPNRAVEDRRPSPDSDT